MVQDKTHATCSSCVAMTAIFLYALLLKDSESLQLDSICKFYKALGTFVATDSMPACNLFILCSEHNIVHISFTVGGHQQLFFFIHQLAH